MKLYEELATWWPLLSPVDDYFEEATFVRELLQQQGLPQKEMPEKPSLLELGAGGGSYSFHLKSLFAQVVLSDLSSQMVEVSRKLNPECEHLVGDMRTLRLNRTFDVVLVHDAIDYMTNLSDLRAAIDTVRAHCRAGGLAVLIPDAVKETYEPSTEHGGEDSGTRSLRYLEWDHDPDPNDTETTVEYIVAYREGDGPTRVEHEQHRCGLFSLQQWLDNLRGVGFEASFVIDPWQRYTFAARLR